MKNSEKITATLLTTKVIGYTKESGIYDVEEIVFENPKFKHAIKRISINHSGIYGEELVGKNVTVSLHKNVFPQITSVICDYKLPEKNVTSDVYGVVGLGKSSTKENHLTYVFFDEKIAESITNDGKEILKETITKVDEFINEKNIAVKFGEYLAKNYFCAYHKSGKFFHPKRKYLSVDVIYDEFLVELKSGNLDA